MATKEQENKEKQVAIADAEALEKINYAKQTRSFSAEWAKEGHAAIPAYADIAAYKEEMSKDTDMNKLYDSRFIIKSTVGMVDLGNTAHLKGTLQTWASSFTGFCEKSTVKRSQAELTSAMGLGELDALWKEVLPPGLQFTSGLPSLQAQLAKSFLYGYLDTSFSIDFETNFLGCVRYQAVGYTSYLLCDASELADGLANVLNIKPPVSLQQMKQWMESLNNAGTDLSTDALKQIREAGINVKHTILEPGQILVVLPGTLVATAVVRSSKVHGVLRHFLPKGPAARKQFAALIPCCGENVSAMHFLQTTLDLMAMP